MRHRSLGISCAIVLSLTASNIFADLSLETETARLVKPGHFEVSAAAEYQYSRLGQEVAIPFAFEMGLLPRLELLIEPIPYVGIFPRTGKGAQSYGDVEATLTFLAIEEQKLVPAIAVAGEVKIPTARNLQIGTRVADYAIYLIGSKQFGDVDVHANVAYTFVGQPSGVSVKNRWSVALAAEYNFAPKWDLFGEIMYTTSAVGRTLRSRGVSGVGGEGDGSTASASAEVGGIELFGTLGLKYHLQQNIDIFTSVTYDNADATLVRTGITWKF